MKKKICFFSVGFAFNRLVRMKFYENIFPKNIEIFLYTTTKYAGKENENYQDSWAGLKRTKIIAESYNPVRLFFNLRRFCRQNKIERIFNLGFHTSAILLWFSTLFTKTDYCLNVLTDIFNQHWIVQKKSEAIKEFLTLIYLFPFIHLSKKNFYTDKTNVIRASRVFLSSKNKNIYLAAPVNTSLFKIKNKEDLRKKLKIPKNKKVIIFVGRINYLKCSDIFKKIIVSNSDKYFIVIGRLLDKELLKINTKNFKWIEKLPSEKLVDYYNASDFSFCVNRGGGGIGLTSEEALACGVPIIVSKHFKLKKSKAVYQTEINFEQINKTISNFFKLLGEEKKKSSKIARKYVEENYSDKIWKEKYVNAYLN